MYYGVDLLDVYTRKVSLRKAGVLIDRLPPESATMTAIRLDNPKPPSKGKADPEQAVRMPWSSDQMLIAQLIDEVRRLDHTVRSIVSSKGQSVPEPEPVYRPGIKLPKSRKERRQLTVAQLKALDPRLRPGSGYEFEDGRGGSA